MEALCLNLAECDEVVDTPLLIKPGHFEKMPGPGDARQTGLGLVFGGGTKPAFSEEYKNFHTGLFPAQWRNIPDRGPVATVAFRSNCTGAHGRHCYGLTQGRGVHRVILYPAISRARCISMAR